MPKLYFRYGTMNSSKTANLLMVSYNYKTQGKKVILIKPSIDIRFNKNEISSRAIKNSMKADIIATSSMNIFAIPDDTSCVLVDEVQFMSIDNINALRKLTLKVPVICYGLRTDYRSQLFSGSKRLMEIADTIEEIKTVCVNCNKKAIINAKFFTNNTSKIITRDGSEEPDLGAEEKYQPMCWFCWTNS